MWRMANPFQITIDCADPERLVTFWSEALGYRPQPPPADFPNWAAYYRHIGVPEEELVDIGDGTDRIIDPEGAAPPIWFQIVPEQKVGKNRLHFDLRVSGGRAIPLEERRRRVRVRVDTLVASGATVVREDEPEGIDHFYVVMQDPEGNEFCVA